MAGSAFVFAATANAADQRLELNNYLDWETVANPQISPDGSQIVYTRRRVNKMTDKIDSEIWVMTAAGMRNRMLVKGSSPIWSPDGERLAYTAKGAGDKPQVFVRWMDAEANTTQVTHVEYAPGGVSWSPDGARIAFTATVPFEPDWTIELDKPEGAEWTKNATIIDTTHHRQDRRGPFTGYDHIFVIPADGGTARQVTEGEWNVGKPRSGLGFGAGALAWTPDSQSIVFQGVTDDEGEPQTVQERIAFLGTSHIQMVNLASGEIAQLSTELGSWGGASVSPDGTTVLYGGSILDESTYNASEIRAVNIDGSNERVIVAELAGGRGNFKWSSSGNGVYYSAQSEGTMNVQFLELATGDTTAVTTGTHMLSLSSISENGIAVATRSSAHETGDVVSFNISNGEGLTELTHVNDDILVGVTLGDVEEIWYDSSDNTRVQGWIVKPPNFDPTRKYPMVLSIHGGPHGMYNTGFNFRFQEFAAKDYVVVYVNPRGSTGYGADFANAIDNAYPGYRDFDDLMAGVDVAVSRGYIDESKMYVTGCSGGGVLTSWVVSHTDRFAAGAALCPVINWIGFAGTADIVGWGYHRFHESFWENPEPWLEHSPLMHADKVNTPTLVMTGDRDLRTPIAEAEEFYTALKMNGVETKLVVMHGEFHGTTSIPSNMLRTQLILDKWFKEHVKGSEQVASAGENVGEEDR